MNWLSCSDEAIVHLQNADKDLGRAIGVIGSIRREITPDPFAGLIRAIIGQQISSAAHAALWRRLREKLPVLTPDNLIKLDLAGLRECGLSGRKAETALRVAREFATGSLRSKSLRAMSDEALINRLTAIKGVGLWTAEMTLIFTFRRRDVFSYGDAGLRKGLRMLKNLKEITPEIFAWHGKLYSPYGSTACLYLWRIASGQYPRWHDPATPKSPGGGKA